MVLSAHLSPEPGVEFGPSLIAAGIAVLILLPVIRVTITLIIFLRNGEYRFSAVTGLVLAILLLTFIIGIFSRRVAR